MNQRTHLINDIIKKYLCDDILKPLLSPKNRKSLNNMDPAIYIKICGFIPPSRFISPIKLFTNARIAILDYYKTSKTCVIELSYDKTLNYGINFEDANEIIIVIRKWDVKIFTEWIKRIKNDANICIYLQLLWYKYEGLLEAVEKKHFGKLSIYNYEFTFTHLIIGRCKEFYIELINKLDLNNNVKITNFGCDKINIVIRAKTDVNIDIHGSDYIKSEWDFLSIKTNGKKLFYKIPDTLHIKTFVLESTSINKMVMFKNVDIALMIDVLLTNNEINDVVHPNIGLFFYGKCDNFIKIINEKLEYSKAIDYILTGYVFETNPNSIPLINVNNMDFMNIVNQKLIERKKKKEHDIIKLNKWKSDLKMQISKKRVEKHTKM